MKITINQSVIEVSDQPTSLLSVIQNNNFSFSAPCGGKGTCGKCKVQVIPAPTPSKIEEGFLSAAELKDSIRLACEQHPIQGHNYTTFENFLYIEDNMDDINICNNPKLTTRVINPLAYPNTEAVGLTSQLSLNTDNITLLQKIASKFFNNEEFQLVESDTTLDLIPVNNTLYGCAIDIGTTTVVMKYYNLQTGKCIQSEKFENPQASYGADVISRINYTMNETYDGCLSNSIQNEIYTRLLNFEKQFNQVHHFVVSGNTVMSHLFMDLDITSLGAFPFNYTASQLLTIQRDSIFKDHLNGLVEILPPLSAFVGGDITVGIIALDIQKTTDWSLLIDLGTNGELALGSQEGLWVTSTAAGPVFEGASLDCGMPASPGAIYDLSDEIKVIGDIKAKGICGTGAISILGYLLEKELIDETGRFINQLESKTQYAITDTIFLSQKDVRALQTAKSAIRTGIDILIDSAPIPMDAIDHVYIAGGFGNNINVDAFIQTGILPMALKSKIKLVGNTSLKGAIKCLLNKENLLQSKELKEMTSSINLSEHPKFQDYYIDNMYFNEEDSC